MNKDHQVAVPMLSKQASCLRKRGVAHTKLIRYNQYGRLRCDGYMYRIDTDRVNGSDGTTIGTGILANITRAGDRSTFHVADQLRMKSQM